MRSRTRRRARRSSRRRICWRAEGEATPRPDQRRSGHGGTDTVRDPAMNLSDRADPLLLSPDPISRLDRNQIQRIRSSDHRSSREDWRASKEPMQLTFLAMGQGESDHPEHLRPSDRDPSQGARESGAPHRAGGMLGGSPLPPGEGALARPLGAPAEGMPRASAGLGVRDGQPGLDHRASAKVGLGRPLVQEGMPSVPAAVRGKPADTKDAEQEVMANPSLIHAGTAGGASGPGVGGEDSPGAPGAGGLSGPGSMSRPLGTGLGPGLDIDPRDRRRTDYLRQVSARIYPLWANAFPKWAIAEGLQGTATISFTILSDGSIASVVITRPSGIPEFDENCRRAVLRAAPFSPLPAELGQSLRWAESFEAKNPAIVPRSARNP
ncbi:MAG: energy transducer TonB [Byssovorax sp.]